MYTVRTVPLPLAPGYPAFVPKLPTHVVQPQRKCSPQNLQTPSPLYADGNILCTALYLASPWNILYLTIKKFLFFF